LYNDFIEKKHSDKKEHVLCRSNFYNIFGKYLSHVDIPTATTEFCSRCAFYKAINLDNIDPNTKTTYREQFSLHLERAHNAMLIYNNLKYHRDNEEIVISFDFKSSILLPCIKNPVSNTNYSDKIKIEVFGIIINNRSILPHVYLFEGFDQVSKKEMIMHALSDFVVLLKKTHHFTRLICFADNAAAQNKNQYMIYYLECIRQSFELLSIRYSFMEVGHTHNKVDMFFGQMASILRQCDLYQINDIQSAVHNTSNFAVCRVVKNQYDFSNIVRRAVRIKNISRIQTFTLENGYVWGSEIMLGQRKLNEPMSELLKFEKIPPECIIQGLINEKNKVSSKNVSITGLVSISNTLKQYPSRPKGIEKYYEERFYELIKDDQQIQEYDTGKMIKEAKKKEKVKKTETRKTKKDKEKKKKEKKNEK